MPGAAHCLRLLELSAPLRFVCCHDGQVGSHVQNSPSWSGSRRCGHHRAQRGDIPGDGDARENRLAGLGPLTGIGAGVGVGAAAALVHRYLGHLPKPLGVGVLGLGAMALADGPLAAAGLTDPRAWAASDWASDVLPHLLYGWVTFEVLSALERS